MAARRARASSDPTAPRKPPRQERSEATVATIVEATRRVLIKEGFERVTTNRVAEVAGVSVGSVYQYFPTKEALIARVVEERTNDSLAQLAGLAPRLKGATAAHAVRECLHWYVERWRRDRELLRAIVPHLETVRRLDLVASQNQDGARMVALALGRFKDQLAVRDLELASLLLVTTAEGLMMLAVMSDALLDHPLLCDELTDLALRYLGLSGGAAREL